MKAGHTFFSCPPSSFPRPSAYCSSSSFSPRGTIYQGKSYHGTPAYCPALFIFTPPAYGPTLFIFTPPCVWSCLIHFHTAPCVWSILIYLCFLILTLKESWQTSQPATCKPSSQKNCMENQSNISPYKKVALILHHGESNQHISL